MLHVTNGGVAAEAIAARLSMNPEFAGKVYDITRPGTTVVVTDQPIIRRRGATPVFEN